MELVLTQPQSEFFSISSKFPLFVGGFGSGKTTTLRTCAMQDFFDFPGADLAIYSATYDLLGMTLINEFRAWFDTMPIRYKYNQQRSCIHVQGYGTMYFRSLNNPDRIIGYEVFRSHVDELDTLPTAKAKKAWQMVIARNRQKHSSGAPNQVRAYTTPEGYSYAYQRWVKGASENYVRVHASTSSNPHNNAGYEEGLAETYPENLRLAYLEGQFTNLNSGNVYSSFSREHNHEQIEFQPRETLHFGLDFNVTNVNAAVSVIRDNKPYTGAEVTRCMDTPGFIATVKSRFPDHPIVVYPDNNGDSRNTVGASQTDIKLLKEAGFTVVTVRDEKKNKKNPRIKNRVNTVNGLCCSMDGERRWKIDTDKCPELTDAIEQQAWDGNGMPTKDPNNNVDDLCDAAGYFLWSRWPLVRRESSTNKVLAA